MYNPILTEQDLLGLLFIERDINLWQKAKSYLNKRDFSDTRHQIIFEAIDKVIESGFEEVNLKRVMNHLKKHNKLQAAGGEKYFHELLNSEILKSDFEHLVKEITDFSNRQNLIQILKSSLNELQNTANNSDDILPKIEAKLISSIRNEDISELRHVKNAVADAQELFNKRMAGTAPTGLVFEYNSVDKIIGGLQQGDMMVLGARPSMGKTALGLNIGYNIAKSLVKNNKKNNVAFFSLEMKDVALVNRLVTMESQLPGNKIRDANTLSHQEVVSVNRAFNSVSKVNMFIDEVNGAKLGDLVWKAKKLHKNIGLELIIIDYLQYMSIGERRTENRQQELATISRTLKYLAKDLSIPIIIISQLNRELAKRQDKRPNLSDIRGSGTIEQDADIIAFLHSDRYYNVSSDDDDVDKSNKYIWEMELIIAKNRNGETGIAKLVFNKNTSTFFDIKSQG